MGKPNLAPIRPLLDEAAHDRLMTMNNWPCSAFRPACSASRTPTGFFRLGWISYRIPVSMAVTR